MSSKMSSGSSVAEASLTQDDDTSQGTAPNSNVSADADSLTQSSADTGKGGNNTSHNGTDDEIPLSKLREKLTVKGKFYFKTVRYELFKYKCECIFRCLKCTVTKKTQKGINEHFKTTHGTFTCGACDKVCNTMSAFRKHAYEHSYRAKKFSCANCNKGFPFMSQLKAHRKVHLMALEHHYLKCNKSYKNEGELVKHQSTHSGKTWLCQAENCKYSCQDPRNLCAHMHKHGPDNRYSCV